jgi:hypothetical protein
MRVLSLIAPCFMLAAFAACAAPQPIPAPRASGSSAASSPSVTALPSARVAPPPALAFADALRREGTVARTPFKVKLLKGVSTTIEATAEPTAKTSKNALGQEFITVSFLYDPSASAVVCVHNPNLIDLATAAGNALEPAMKKGDISEVVGADSMLFLSDNKVPILGWKISYKDRAATGYGVSSSYFIQKDGFGTLACFADDVGFEQTRGQIISRIASSFVNLPPNDAIYDEVRQVFLGDTSLGMTHRWYTRSPQGFEEHFSSSVLGVTKDNQLMFIDEGRYALVDRNARLLSSRDMEVERGCESKNEELTVVGTTVTKVAKRVGETVQNFNISGVPTSSLADRMQLRALALGRAKTATVSRMNLKAEPPSLELAAVRREGKSVFVKFSDVERKFEFDDAGSIVRETLLGATPIRFETVLTVGTLPEVGR